MDRKVWLEKFLALVHGGAGIRQYRALGISKDQLRDHICKWPEYAKELDKISKAEEKAAIAKVEPKPAPKIETKAKPTPLRKDTTEDFPWKSYDSNRKKKDKDSNED